MQAANAKFGKGIVEFKVPFLAAATGLSADYPGGEASILGKKRVRRDLEGIDAVCRNAQAELSRGRIGDVDGIHQQSIVLLVRSGNIDLPILPPDYARRKRQHICNGLGTRRQALDLAALQLNGRRRGL